MDRTRLFAWMIVVVASGLLGMGCLGKCDPKQEECRSTPQTAQDAGSDAPSAPPQDAGLDTAIGADTGLTPDTGPACLEDGTCECAETQESCSSDCFGCFDDGECDQGEDCACADCYDLCTTSC